MFIVSILLAIIALGFLIFIHELGHYVMAKRVGMKVDTFSIGMGRPIFSWMSDGTQWQLGWLPFGGFIKIAGTETDKNQDLSQVKDGYFSKTPWERIKVSVMGPLVNLIFALLAFALLWVSGGLEKPFSEYTKKIGDIDPKSELYAQGIRQGDEIWSINGIPYNGMHDLLYFGMTNTAPLAIEGGKVNYTTGEKTPFSMEIKPYTYPLARAKNFMTTGVLAPANYLMYDKLLYGGDDSLIAASPMNNSGIESGDHLVAIDGKRIFSLSELAAILNEGKALVTVERNGKPFIARIPRVKIHDLKLPENVRNEFSDWQFAANLQGIKFPSLLVLPYNMTNSGVIENALTFIVADEEEAAFPKNPDSALEQTLLSGDKIIAIDGTPVKHSSEILKLIQERTVQLIVSRSSEKMEKISWQSVDPFFDKSFNSADFDAIVKTIGTDKPLTHSGTLILLKPIKPKKHQEIYAESKQMNQAVETYKKQIAALDDPIKKTEALKALEKNETKLELGLPLKELKVEYNPLPTTQFMNIVKDIGKTLKSLVTGSLNLNLMSGPVGIVSVFQEQSRSGVGQTLFWLGLISLNLGILNLLPIPPLDGGTIVINLIEMISGKKIKPETLEKIILPFVILFILFFLYVTFYDIKRLFGGF